MLCVEKDRQNAHLQCLKHDTALITQKMKLKLNKTQKKVVISSCLLSLYVEDVFPFHFPLLSWLQVYIISMQFSHLTVGYTAHQYACA